MEIDNNQFNFDKNYIQNVLEGRVKDKHLHQVTGEVNLTEEQRTTMKKFNDYLTAQHRTIGSRKSYMGVLKIFGLYVKRPFENVIKEDLLNYFRDIEPEFKPRTFSTHQAVIKVFFKWLYNTDEPPEIVKWIKQSRKNQEMKLPEQLLTREDLNKMLCKCDNVRDQAVIMMLFEGAFRVNEMVGVNIGDLIHDEYGIRVKVSGKTGNRIVRILDTIPYLQSWLNVHPDKDNNKSPLFIDLSKKSYGKRLYRDGIYQMLKEVGKKARIQKNITCHLLRHQRLTELAKLFTEQELKVFAGWSGDSRMCKVYIHLSGEDVDRKFREKYELEKEEKPTEKSVNILEPKKCYKCGLINPPTAKYCKSCKMILDIKTIMLLEEKRRLLEEKFENVYPVLLVLKDNPDLLNQLKKRTKAD